MRARWPAAAKQSGRQDIWREDRSSSECPQIRGSKKHGQDAPPRPHFCLTQTLLTVRVLSQKHGLWLAYWTGSQNPQIKLPRWHWWPVRYIWTMTWKSHNCFRVPRWLEEQEGQPKNSGENRWQLQVFLKSLSNTYWETTRDFPGGPVAKTLSSQRRRPRVQSLVTLQIRVHMPQLRPRAGKQISILK